MHVKFDEYMIKWGRAVARELRAGSWGGAGLGNGLGKRDRERQRWRAEGPANWHTKSDVVSKLMGPSPHQQS